MTRDEWMVLPDGTRLRKSAVTAFGPIKLADATGLWYSVYGEDRRQEVYRSINFAEFEALLFGGEPGSGEYGRAAPLKAVLEQERDTARQQRDDYKRQLMELQWKCEAMTGASTYGNVAVRWAEAEAQQSEHYAEMPDDCDDEGFDEWRERRDELSARGSAAREAFLRLYREREARRG